LNETIDSHAIDHAALQARLLSATAGFRPDEIDDARQELLLDYLRRLPKYDSTRGNLTGFTRGVMRHRATVLIGRRSGRVRREVLADDLRQTNPDDSTDVLEIIH
jgi:DNA-directed RNA polymerase specialized sigma24 family protein